MISMLYCGNAKNIAPHIDKKWLPDDAAWWTRKTLEVADIAVQHGNLRTIPVPTVQDSANLLQLATRQLH